MGLRIKSTSYSKTMVDTIDFFSNVVFASKIFVNFQYFLHKKIVNLLYFIWVVILLILLVSGVGDIVTDQLIEMKQSKIYILLLEEFY